MTEYELIQKLAGTFTRSKRQKNTLFECDAEIIEIGGRLWGMSLDEFSPVEDLFTAEDPTVLGANLAVATISDLLAAGASPEFFMHGICLPVGSGDGFVEGLATGIQRVLAEAGCSLCGGDLGTAETWRYCGFAMGPVQATHPVTRCLPCKPQSLWVTGKVGDANLAAYTESSTPVFELRLSEAALVSRYATGCIDTSGGLLDALWLLQKQNAGLRFELDLEAVPYAEGTEAVTDHSGIPRETVLVGGAGEYELVFTVSDNLTALAVAEIEAMEATRIGKVYPDSDSGLFYTTDSGCAKPLTETPPCPRGAENIEAYIAQVLQYTKKWFGS
ncbi:MAG: AIR synthase related protein [Lentisphaeria bacterium]